MKKDKPQFSKFWSTSLLNKPLNALYLILFITLSTLISCADRIIPPSKPAFGLQQAHADYIGEVNCTSCHQQENKHWSHTIHARIFHLPGAKNLSAKTCEACHGPGSEHIKNPFDKGTIIAFSRNSVSTVKQQNAMCLQCHTGEQRLHWPGSIHQVNDLACNDCHNPMAKISSQGLLTKQDINQTCFSCHKQQRAEFRKRSHMPLPEGKMSCVDCHQPHGSNTEPLLADISVNQLCYQCHTEKRGPFIWEHAPVRENCLNCHQPHGSNHEFLLTSTRPFLCQSCHTNRGHPNDLMTTSNIAGGSSPDSRLMNRSCQNCHVQIHGSNHPSGVRLHR